MEDNSKAILKKMAAYIGEMVDLVYKGLMENQTHYLNSALNKERIIDGLEENAMSKIADSAKSGAVEDQRESVLFGQTAQNIERMGDELRYLMERIEIKIAEKLLFSDMGIKQYLEVFETMRVSVSLTMEFLTTGETGHLDKILKNGEHIKELIERYRTEHMVRLTKGICEPRTANMYFDMLDFTGNVARHCTNIVKIHKEEK